MRKLIVLLIFLFLGCGMVYGDRYTDNTAVWQAASVPTAGVTVTADNTGSLAIQSWGKMEISFEGSSSELVLPAETMADFWPIVIRYGTTFTLTATSAATTANWVILD